MKKTIITSALSVMKHFIFLFLSICLFSCSGKKINEVGELSIYDSISVPIDFPILSKYIKLIPYCNGDSVYITGYNYYEHSIDFINLTNGDNFIIPLQHEGPNGVLPVHDYCFAANRIICKDESGILTLDMDGNVIDRLPVKELVAPPEEYSVRPLGASLSNYLYLNNWSSKIFIPLSPTKKGDKVHIGKIFDISKRSLEFLPPYYPTEIVGYTQYLGGLSVPDINMYGTDKIVYNFPFSSLVYLYDTKTATTEVLDIQTKTIDNNIDFEKWKGLDVVDKVKQELYMSRFGRVYYSSSTEKYYRIHWAMKEEGEGKLRKIYLMIFDKKGNSLKEYLLPSHFSEQYFFFQDTLYFACRSSNDTSFNVVGINLEMIKKE